MSHKDPHILLDAVARLETLRNQGRNQGQRQFNRWVVRGDAELLPEDGQTDRLPVPVLIRDLSWGGLGFLCDRELPVNSLWRVHFLAHHHVVGQMTMLIRHGRKVDDDLFLIGGQFVADPGLLHILGVGDVQVRLGDENPAMSANFLPPAEVA